MKPIRLMVLLIFAALSSLPARAANPDWPKSLTIATASPGGVYLPYGRFLAKLLTDKIGIPVDAISTQGPVQNVKLLDLGEAQVGFVTMGIALQGWNGAGDWTSGKSYSNMRALFPMYDTPFQLVVLRNSGITTLQGIDTRSIGVGPRAGTGGTYIPNAMKILGIAPTIKYGAIDDQTSDLLAGRLDAFATMTGVPVPAVSAAEVKEPLTFITLTSDQISAVRKAIPELSPSIISAKTYKSLAADYETFGVYNFAVGRSDLPDDLVYQMIKAVFDNREQLARDQPVAVDTVPQNVVKDTFLPLHPGAIRYYREIGVQIEPKLIPGM